MKASPSLPRTSAYRHTYFSHRVVGKGVGILRLSLMLLYKLGATAANYPPLQSSTRGRQPIAVNHKRLKRSRLSSFLWLHRCEVLVLIAAKTSTPRCAVWEFLVQTRVVLSHYLLLNLWSFCAGAYSPRRCNNHDYLSTAGVPAPGRLYHGALEFFVASGCRCFGQAHSYGFLHRVARVPSKSLASMRSSRQALLGAAVLGRF